MSPRSVRKNSDAKKAPRPTQTRPKKAQSAQEASAEEVGEAGDGTRESRDKAEQPIPPTPKGRNRSAADPVGKEPVQDRGLPCRSPVLELAQVDPHADVADLLAIAWWTAIEAGRVEYDPVVAERFDVGSYRFHRIPGREERPGSQSSTVDPRGLFRPHGPCPFDGVQFVQRREIFRIRSGDRQYHLVCNRYPTTRLHFLLVRERKVPASALLQVVQSQAEVEDLARLAVWLRFPYRVYFNSNYGADGSFSGSSVNHWHAQFLFLPQQPGALEAAKCLPGDDWCDEEVREGDALVRRGSIRGWPAIHHLHEADEAGALARSLWREIKLLNARNWAYNLELFAIEGCRLRGFLFARAPCAAVEVPGAGVFGANFGGWELSGDIVVLDPLLMDWVRQNGDEAVRISAERLRESTRAVN